MSVAYLVGYETVLNGSIVSKGNTLIQLDKPITTWSDVLLVKKLIIEYNLVDTPNQGVPLPQLLITFLTRL